MYKRQQQHLGTHGVAADRLEAPAHLLDDLIDAEARRPLTRRIVFEAVHESGHDRLRRDERRRPIRHEKIVVGVRGDVRTLIGVGAQIKDLRYAQRRKRLGPNSHRAGCALLLEDEFPVLITCGDEIAVVVEVDELLACTARLLAGEVRKLIVAVEVDLEGLGSSLMAPEQLVLCVRIARRRHQGRQPVEPADHLVGNRA